MASFEGIYSGLNYELKIQYNETTMPLENFKESDTKMNEKFSPMRVSHGVEFHVYASYIQQINNKV